MLYPILPDSDPILHAVVEPFDFSNPGIDPIELAESLRETMLSKGAFGLAANQCGLPYRAFVLNDPDGGEPIAFFNPVITSKEGSLDGREGCLTYPGLFLSIKRSAKVVVTAQDVHGETFIREFEGYHARGVEHETDHLNGITFVKHVSKLKLEMTMKKKGR